MENLLAILKTDTLRKSSITFSSTFINGILGMSFFLLTARFLGPISFGLMTVAIAVNTLVTDISDLGVDSGLVRFVGKYANTDSKKTREFLKLGLVVKISVGILISSLGFSASPFIASSIFAKPELAVPLRIASLGVLGALLFDFSTHSLQSFQRFFAWGGLFVGTNLLRLVLVVILIALNILNLDNTLYIYILMPFLGFVFSLFLLPSSFLKSKITKSTKKDFLHYNKWIALMTAVAATSSRVDIFISARILDLDQVGIYSAASQLVQVVPQLAASIGTVLAPKMASKTDTSDLLSYLKKSQLMVSAIVILGILAMPASFFLIPVVLGANYVASVPVFLILFTAMLIFLFSIPIHNTVFYFFSYPKLFFYLAITQLIVISSSSLVLVNMFGTSGLAMSVLLGSTLNFIVPAIWVFRKINKSI